MKNLKLLEIAPTFVAQDENGNKIDSKTLLGKNWVLYFYPKDLTPGCTNQACNIRDNYKLLQDLGVSIIGVSMDDAKLHKRFIEKHELPFPLICDLDKQLIELYGVWGEKKFMGKVYDGIHRTTFVMNEQSQIIAIIDKPKTKAHAEEIIEIYQNKK